MIIQSILDSDLYKFTMQNAVIQCFPDIIVENDLFNRNDINFPEGFDTELIKEISLMRNLKLTEKEKQYLIEKYQKKENFGIFPSTYINYLDNYRFNPSEVMVFMENSKLKVKIRGYMHRTILWEVPVLAIISELYYKMTLKEYPTEKTLHKLDELDFDKALKLKSSNCFFSDFGTRRRFSFENQLRVVKNMKEYGGANFTGTSNVYIAYLLGIKAFGTMAHEWIMLNAAIYGYKMANEMAMKNWVKVYDGDLGIALPDTYTTSEFLKTFSLMEAKLFDGVRHDSGDPFEFVDKVVEFYKAKKINPLHKVIVFSDGLNVELALKLKDYCAGKIMSAFGIGTFFTNDLKSIGILPLNIVIKITKVFVNGVWVDCVKLSDNSGKHTGARKAITLCKDTFGIGEITYNHLPAGNEDDKVIKENIVE